MESKQNASYLNYQRDDGEITAQKTLDTRGPFSPAGEVVDGLKEAGMVLELEFNHKIEPKLATIKEKLLVSAPALQWY